MRGFVPVLLLKCKIERGWAEEDLRSSMEYLSSLSFLLNGGLSRPFSIVSGYMFSFRGRAEEG